MPAVTQGEPWTNEEDELLRLYYGNGKTSLEELATVFPGRTKFAVRGRAAKLGIRPTKEPRWTTEQVAFLREHFGRKRLAWIAKQLGRTEIGVKMKAKHLGLRHRNRRALTPSQIGRMLNKCSKTVKSWITLRWLNARVAPTAGKRIYLVEPEDLIAFLRQHPEEWDARRCPNLHIRLGLTTKHGEAALSDRPLWLKEKLAADIRQGKRKKRWTPEEDIHLAHLVKRGLSYPQIAKLVGRTAHAIDHRVHRLGRRIWDLAKEKGA